MTTFLYFVCISLINIQLIQCNQFGPDPWHYAEEHSDKLKHSEGPVPPDLKMPLKSKMKNYEVNSIGDWFFKRTLAILLKSGQVKENEDSFDISVQMKLSKDKWNVLNEYIAMESAFTDEMFRRIIGYIEDGIYKPSFTENIALAWNEYIYIYLSAYKTELTYLMTMLSFVMACYMLWNKLSRRQVQIFLFIVLYLYEAVVSYKEAEQLEYKQFVSAVSHCKWYFWSSSCDVPAPDLLLFLKYMHPLKICVRLFSIVITEPMMTISSVVNQIVHGITDDLWYPLNSIVSAFMILGLNIILILILIMVLFNFILNIPFNLSFFAGLISFGVKQRNRTIIDEISQPPADLDHTGDRISGTNLNALLNIIANTHTLHNSTQIPNNTPHILNNIPQILNNNNKGPNLTRSASAGRLTDISRPFEELNNPLSIKPEGLKKRLGFSRGGGDN